MIVGRRSSVVVVVVVVVAVLVVAYQALTPTTQKYQHLLRKDTPIRVNTLRTCCYTSRMA